jgi:polar amino acid transport system substrate-binding protein
MPRIAAAIASFALLARVRRLPVPPLAKFDLAPSGSLRAGINFGNVLLTGKDPKTGEPRGVAVDLARELGRRLGVPVEIVPFDSAGAMADAVRPARWTSQFLAVEPQRANEIAFTAAYAEIEAPTSCPQARRCEPSPTWTVPACGLRSRRKAPTTSSSAAI